jgi:hypothetical protein
MRLPPGWLKTQNMDESAQVAWAHALSNLCGWTIESFISWRHRAVSIFIVGIIITIALAGLLITWDRRVTKGRRVPKAQQAIQVHLARNPAFG